MSKFCVSYCVSRVLLDTLIPVQKWHSRAALQTFSLHQHCLPTAYDTSFLVAAHLPSRSTDSYISYEMKRSLEEQNTRSSCTKKQISSCSHNHDVWFFFRFSSVFPCSETDPWWWMIIIYPKNLIFILGGFLTCSLPLYTLCSFIYMVTAWILLWVTCKSVHTQHVNVALMGGSTHYE